MYSITRLDNINYNPIAHLIVDNETQKKIIDSLYNIKNDESLKKIIHRSNKYSVSLVKKTIVSKKRSFHLTEPSRIEELSIVELVIFKNKMNILKFLLLKKSIPINNINKAIKLCENLKNYECKILLENYKHNYDIKKQKNRKSESLRKKVLNVNLNELNEICSDIKKEKKEKRINSILKKFAVKKQSINSLCKEFKNFLNLKQ